MPQSFKLDLEQIRARAAKNLRDGPRTAAYDAQQTEVVDVLNEVLATEMVCSLRYMNNQYVAQGLGAHRVAQEFAEHAAEEAAHRDRVASRIDQLGGVPNFNPVELAQRSLARYASAGS